MAVDFKEYARKMDKALEHLNEEFGAVRAGRANAKVLDRITVEYYGTWSQAINITLPEWVPTGDYRLVGEIVWNGKKITSLNDDKLAIFRRKNCGFVFQQMHLVSNLTMFENVAVSGYLNKLKSSAEGEVFWYPLSKLHLSKELIDGFEEMLPVFTTDDISEVFYERCGDDLNTVFC